ncbi:MAG: CpsD/CapB family tyrosine-protein kinase [Mariniblastus sp.]
MIQQQTTTHPKSVKRSNKKLWPIYSNLAEQVFKSLDGESNSVVVGCAGFAKGEGATTVSTNLAIAFSMIFEHDVLLINATERPMGIGSLLGGDPKTGIEQVINEEVEISDAIVSTTFERLHFLNNGLKTRAPFSPHLLAKFPELLETLRAKYKVIVVDLPQLNQPSSSGPLTSRVDGMLVVLQPGKVKSDTAKRIKQQLDRNNVKLLGAVMNRCD